MALLVSKQACKFFGGLKAVNHVDMQVEEGEIFGIIGPNGAGKTTFFNLCAGTYPLTSGEIWFDGINISGYRPHQAAKAGIARTFQNIQLFKLMSVLDTLTPREEKVLRLRFGLDDGRARTLEEVGREFKVTRERIRQIEAKALRKLRHPSRSRKLKDFLD